MNNRLEVLKLAIERRDPAGEAVSDTLARADALLAWVEPPAPTVIIMESCPICEGPITPGDRSALHNVGIIFPKRQTAHLACIQKRAGNPVNWH